MHNIEKNDILIRSVLILSKEGYIILPFIVKLIISNNFLWLLFLTSYFSIDGVSGQIWFFLSAILSDSIRTLPIFESL
jgi:hypothetical protein